MKRLFFLFGLLTLIISCNDDKEGQNTTSSSCKNSCSITQLRSLKKLQIPVLGYQYDFDICTIFQNGDTTEFWGYSQYDKMFFIFNLFDEKLIDTIPIFINGENALPEVYGFKVLSPDSILIHTNHYNQLVLINARVEKVRTWTIQGNIPGTGRSEDNYYLAVWEDYNNFYPDVEFKKITFQIEHMGFKSWITPFKYPQFVQFDLASEQFLPAFGDFPATYQDEKHTNYRSSFPFAVVDDQTWASFFHSHEIYVFENTEKLRSICSKSRFLPPNFDFLPAGLTPTERDPLLIPKGEYRNLIYDPFRQLFYRIPIHGLPEGTPTGRDYSMRLQSKWSIMFLNTAGVCLGEVVFEKNKYDFDRIFPVKEGLLISLENPFSEENQEDLLSFELFEMTF